MAFQDLQGRFALLKRLFDLTGADIYRSMAAMERKSGALLNITTYRRHLNSPDDASEAEKEDLVQAVCTFLTEKRGRSISPRIFKANDHVFLTELEVSVFDRALAEKRSLPMPEIFVDSLYQRSDAVEARVGRYLLFRHERDDIDQEKPYIQACAEISDLGDGRFLYRDYWVTRVAYTGYVFCVGGVTNIVGENVHSKEGVREIWWCGLEKLQDGDDAGMKLYGYVSDLRANGALFTDRIVLVRVPDEAWDEIRKANVSHTNRDSLVDTASESLAIYLDAWKSIELGRPR